MYINDVPQAPGVYLALFADDICLYATDRKSFFFVRKLQRGLSSMKAWFERWKIKVSEDKTYGIYFSRSRRPPEFHLALNGRNIPFVNSVKYLGVIFDKKVAWRLHIEMIEAKVFRTFIRIYSLFKSERLSTNIKLTNQSKSRKPGQPARNVPPTTTGYRRSHKHIEAGAPAKGQWGR
jgi:hypothetical protein